MGTAKRFWNAFADRYSKQPIADEANYRKKLEITQRYLEPGMNVVEFGCGTGATAVEHAPHVATYHGIDVSDRMVEIGRGRAAEAGLSNLDFSVGTLEEVGLPEEHCDAMLALNILHLLPDLEGTLWTVSRSLRPGGRFVSSTICATDLGGRMGTIVALTRFLPVFPTVTRFSATELEARVERAGFAIDERFEQAPGVLFLVATKR